MLAQSRIRTLGFLLDEEGIHPDPLNLAKIKEWPIPVDVKQIRQYLGLTSYFRSHIPHFAKIAEPLTDLLVRDKAWQWTENEQFAYAYLKH